MPTDYDYASRPCKGLSRVILWKWILVGDLKREEVAERYTICIKVVHSLIGRSFVPLGPPEFLADAASAVPWFSKIVVISLRSPFLNAAMDGRLYRCGDLLLAWYVPALGNERPGMTRARNWLCRRHGHFAVTSRQSQRQRQRRSCNPGPAFRSRTQNAGLFDALQKYQGIMGAGKS